MKDRPWYHYALLGIIIFGLLYLVYFNPKNKQIKSIKAERIKVENEVRNLKQKKKQLDQIKTDVQDMTETLKELEAIIPQEEEISSILSQIQELAYNSRVNIEKFTPKKLAEKEFYSEKPIEIEFSGNYDNLTRFFESLSKFSRLFNVDDFSIKALAKQSDASTIAVNSTAKTYIFPINSPKPKQNQKKPGKKK